MKYHSIILAAGHGGGDTGAVSTDKKHTEREQAIRIVDKMSAVMRSRGANVIIAPHAQDTHDTIKWINATYGPPGCIAFEIHRDSADGITEAKGASTRLGVYHSGSAPSLAISNAWVNHVKSLGAHGTSWARNHKEVRFGSLGWINQIKCRSLLLELGFMEGRNDDAHLDWLAETAANGLLEALA